MDNSKSRMKDIAEVDDARADRVARPLAHGPMRTAGWLSSFDSLMQTKNVMVAKVIFLGSELVAADGVVS